MNKGDLVNECKRVGIKGCNKRMKEETLITRLMNAKHWEKESIKKKSGKKLVKKPGAKERKCGTKICDPGKICDASSKRGACIKRTKGGDPYGSQKLKDKYTDYFFYDDDDYLLLGEREDVNRRLAEWGAKLKKKKPVSVSESDDETAPQSTPKPKPSSKKHPFRGKDIGCRDPYGSVICGQGRNKDKPYCGLATGKCIKSSQNKYVKKKFNKRTFVGSAANIDLLNKYLKDNQVNVDSPVVSESSKPSKLEKYNKLHKEKCGGDNCVQDECDKARNKLIKLRKMLGITGDVARLSCPKSNTSDLELSSDSESESESESDTPPSDDDGVSELSSDGVGGVSELSSDDVGDVSELSSDSIPELPTPSDGVTSDLELSSDSESESESESESDDDSGIDIVGDSGIDIVGDPGSDVSSPTPSISGVKRDDDIQRVFTKCLSML